MTSGHKAPDPPAGTPASEAEDPWDMVARRTRWAMRGSDFEDSEERKAVEDIGDTSQLVRRRPGEVEQAGQAASNEILEALTFALEQSPERVDLWMMRFDVQKTHGLKAEFITAMRAGWEHPRMRRQMDWSAVCQMWDELAPGEPLPPDIHLRKPQAAVSAAPGQVPPAHRRFSDIALQIAGGELEALAAEYAAIRSRPGFLADFIRNVAPPLGRPTPLHHAEILGRGFGGFARIFLKREDARGINHETDIAIAQAYIASAMGRQMLITGNDVDAYSLALTEAALVFGMKCVVVVRPADLERKTDFVARLRANDARIECMPSEGLRSDDPREAALRLWQQVSKDSHLALSFGTGPRPFPTMMADFQSLFGHEIDAQMRAQAGEAGRRTFIAAVHSEADSIGFMLPQLKRSDVDLVYAEPEGGDPASWQSSARLFAYNGAAREHAWLRATGRITYVGISDEEAMRASRHLSTQEGITAGLEDARSMVLAGLLAQRDRKPRDIVVLVA